MEELIRVVAAHPFDLLLLTIALPVAIMGLSVLFTVFMAWRRKTADVE